MEKILRFSVGSVIGVIFIGIIGGYINNIVLLWESSTPLFDSAKLVLRLLGVVLIPMGVVLGYI